MTIHPELRRQNTAVPGAVEQGKTSFLVASVREDLRRERCAVIVLDPKGDAADAALSVVPADRTCTSSTSATRRAASTRWPSTPPPDAIADAVVGAMRNLFDEGDIRASSDRYLRNAIIAALAHDRGATLWDAVRLLSVTPGGLRVPRPRLAAPAGPARSSRRSASSSPRSSPRSCATRAR